MNNRQGGRRRGRGGQSPRGMSGNAGGNARDNRQRGNAAQLLEKYKALARDAQLAGDRVQTEYYLQFADHYFRVLSETRSRFEEQRPRRDDEDEGEELDDEGVEADGEEEGRQDRRRDRGDRDRQDRDRGDRDRQDRGYRNDRGDRGDRPERGDRDGDGNERRERFSRDRDESGERRPRRERLNGRDRDDREDEDTGEDSGPRIAHDILPPAIGIVSSDEPDTSAPADEEEAPRPRRRTRRVRPIDDEGEIAPAA